MSRHADTRAELAELREDHEDHEREIGEAAYQGRGTYMERMVLQTTPGAQVDADGALSYRTETP